MIEIIDEKATSSADPISRDPMTGDEEYFIKSEPVAETLNRDQHVPATPPEFELSPSRIKSAKVGHRRFRYNKPKSVSSKNRNFRPVTTNHGSDHIDDTTMLEGIAQNYERIFRHNKPMTAKMRSRQDDHSINRSTLISTAAPVMTPTGSMRNANLTRGFGSSDNSRGRRRINSFMNESDSTSSTPFNIM